jgi:hypothetical protein
MVIPVGLPVAQQLVVVEKDLNGRVATKERRICIPGILIKMIA